MRSTVQALVKGGLLRETEDDERTYLSHTALGKVATQVSLSPATITLLAKAFAEVENPTDFDLLLLVCLAEEVTPKLGFDFEEIDRLGDLVQEAPSQLLSRTVAQVSAYAARDDVISGDAGAYAGILCGLGWGSGSSSARFSNASVPSRSVGAGERSGAGSASTWGSAAAAVSE